jgi:hypothetical protein
MPKKQVKKVEKPKVEKKEALPTYTVEQFEVRCEEVGIDSEVVKGHIKKFLGI